jgi:ElaB/YqjD/DUF883 family membrane-anchored ribosome-binding protein
MTRLNPESLRLMNHLDSLADDAAPLVDQAAFAAQQTAAKTRANNPSYLSRVTDVFGWLENKAASPIQSLVKKATSVGLAVPFDKDILRFTTMKKSLRSLTLRLQSAKKTQVPHILAMKTPAADLFYDHISTNLTQAISDLTDASAKVDKAQATAQLAKTAISQGRLPAQYTAIFSVQKKMADTAYGRAQTQAGNVYKTLTSWVQANTGKPTVSSYFGAAGSVLTTATRAAGSGAEWAGEEAVAAGKAIAAGAPGLNTILAYWPYIATVGVALYAYQFLPKPQKKS